MIHYCEALLIGKTVTIEVNEEGRVSYNSRDVSPSALREAERLANTESEKINREQHVNNKSSMDLGLLTTSDIASGLKITEEEVIKLIETNELKGKKVGDKYFVRTEDFDAFMKK